MGLKELIEKYGYRMPLPRGSFFIKEGESEYGRVRARVNPDGKEIVIEVLRDKDKEKENRLKEGH